MRRLPAPLPRGVEARERSVSELFERWKVDHTSWTRGKVMNGQKRLTIAFTTLAFGMGVHPALGELVTFEFAGEITGVVDALDLFGGGVTVGSPFSGVYTFESRTPDSTPASPNFGLYQDAISSISGTAGAVSFLGPSEGLNWVDIGNGVHDHYFVSMCVTVSGEPLYLGLTLWDHSGTALSTDELPVVPPDLTLFESAFFTLGNGDETAPVGMAGEVRSLALIPEPGTLFLLSIGGMAALRRKAHKLKNAVSGSGT